MKMKSTIHLSIVSIPSFVLLLCYCSLVKNHYSVNAFSQVHQATLSQRAASITVSPVKKVQPLVPTIYNTRNSAPSSSALHVTGGAEVALVANLPSIKTILTTCLIPSIAGLYRYEYTVSYAYGIATSSSAFLVFKSILSSPSSPLSIITKIHAAALIFYGIRLNLFLLYREVFIQRFRKFREKIEDRQLSKEGGGSNKLKSRIPFILSCACLYAGLASPPFIIARLMDMGASFSSEVLLVYKTMAYLSWFGFGLAAIGDIAKSVSKAKNGEDHIVTGGVFQFVRHPNYFGEMVGWSSSLMASILMVTTTASSMGVGLVLKNVVSPLLLACSGTMGILFVLLSATTNLEKRQMEKYGDNEDYKTWVKSSWAGITLPKKG